MDSMKKCVERLSEKANNTQHPSEALHLSQAALNVAQAMITLASIEAASKQS